jgi:hypothetical protein
MSSTIFTAFVYSMIAFSIVFIVLGGLTLMIYAMRLLPSDEEPKKPSSASANKAAQAAPAAKATESRPLATAGSVKAQHVAAITAAILAATQGAGRILRITPARATPTGGRSTWRAAAVIESVNRGLEPSWKR